MQTADLSGYVCVVTGGRVRIGYQICLKLLRAGATVVATSRWPHDTVLRFAQESGISVVHRRWLLL
jgi:NAD(P)-dependent dehydrogenase (short-subunit alcohol dehydrogenase family)